MIACRPHACTQTVVRCAVGPVTLPVFDLCTCVSACAGAFPVVGSPPDWPAPPPLLPARRRLPADLARHGRPPGPPLAASDQAARAARPRPEVRADLIDLLFCLSTGWEGVPTCTAAPPIHPSLAGWLAGWLVPGRPAVPSLHSRDCAVLRLRCASQAPLPLPPPPLPPPPPTRVSGTGTTMSACWRLPL